MKKAVSLLLTAMLLLVFSGCGEEVPETKILDENYNWRESAVLTYGQLECEKLKLTAWDSGRLAFTAQEGMAETEEGYYFLSTSNSTLYYADKTNLDLWVPVCNQPACSHDFSAMNCNAVMTTNSFLLKDGRLYFPDNLSSDKYQHLHNLEGNAFAIFSRAQDGTDPQLEYVIEESIVSGGSAADLLLEQGWLYHVTKLLQDGSEVATVYLVDETGYRVLGQKDYGQDGYGGGGIDEIWQCYGDRVFHLKTCGQGLFRLADGQLQQVNMTEDDVKNGGYLSGDVLRVYRPGDGYYDIDLNTRQEVKVADARVEDGKATILLPNCIVEQSGYNKDAPANEERIMEIFDGERWRRVELPEAMRYTNTYSANYVCVASDRILFLDVEYSQSGLTVNVYQVFLGRENLVMEPVGRLQQT